MTFAVAFSSKTVLILKEGTDLAVPLEEIDLVLQKNPADFLAATAAAGHVTVVTWTPGGQIATSPLMNKVVTRNTIPVNKDTAEVE